MGRGVRISLVDLYAEMGRPLRFSFYSFCIIWLMFCLDFRIFRWPKSNRGRKWTLCRLRFFVPLHTLFPFIIAYLDSLHSRYTAGLQKNPRFWDADEIHSSNVFLHPYVLIFEMFRRFLGKRPYIWQSQIVFWRKWMWDRQRIKTSFRRTHSWTSLGWQFEII